MLPRSEIRECIDKLRPEILDWLRLSIACNSYCHNKAGVDEVGRMVAEAMPKSFSHELSSQQTVGDHHVFTQHGNGGRPMVLAGHLDTLCPPDPEFDEMVEDGDLLRGPGVNDMKAGDAVIVWSLRVLESCGLLRDLPMVCIFNGDEELGSPTSNSIFRGMAGQAAFALVFECSAPDGTVVVGRKGIQRFRMKIKGKACHFGNLKESKVSAVEELAHKILAVEGVNRDDGSLVANVGRVEGGLLANCVADHAEMDFEFRYWHRSFETEVREMVNRLSGSVEVTGCRIETERLSHRPPMQPNAASRELYERIRRIGESLGIRIAEEKRGGVSDACWLSYVGVPTVDGLGPLGDHDHTPDEYIVTESLFQRIELTANLLIA